MIPNIIIKSPMNELIAKTTYSPNKIIMIAINRIRIPVKLLELSKFITDPTIIYVSHASFSFL